MPQGSVFNLNRPESFYEQHRQLVWGTSAILTCLLAVIFLYVTNIRTRKKVQQRLAVQADTDQLTGVFNRHPEVNRAGEAACSFVGMRSGDDHYLCGCRNLKKINDQYGHTNGDAAIIALRKC